MRVGGTVQVVVGVVLSVAFLALAVHNVRPGEVIEHLRHTRYDFLAASMASGLVMIWARGLRWAHLFHPAAPSGASLASATMIGYMANNFLPLRAGEMIRVYLGMQTGRSFWTVMATLAVERTLDLLVVLLFLGGVLALVPVPAIVRDGAIVLVVLDALLIVTLFVLAARPDGTRKAILWPIRRWAGLQARVDRWLGHFIEGVQCLKPGRHVAPLVGWTVVIWAVNVAGVWLTMAAAGLEVPPSAALTVLVFTGLGLAVPSGPGHLGTLEFFVMLSLAIYGVSSSQALGFSVLLRIAAMLPVTVVGVTLLVGRNLSLRDMRRAARTLRPTGVSK